MLSQIKIWLYGAVMAGFAGLAAFFYHQGRNAEKNKDVLRRLDAVKEKRETEHEVETMDDKRLIDLISRRD